MTDNYIKGLLHIPAKDPNFLHGIKDLSIANLQDMYNALLVMQKTEHIHQGRIAAVAKELRSRSVSSQGRDTSSGKTDSGAVVLRGKQFLGIRDAKKLAAVFAGIAEDEKAAVKLLSKTTRAYYDAGNILAGAIKNWNYKAERLTAKNVAEASGFPERRIMLALKIFKRFENNPDALKGLELRDALKLIAPPPPAGEEGLNRIDLGGDPGQTRLGFGDLFGLPATAVASLQNYRTTAEPLNEIIVVRRTEDGGLVSKRFNTFHEDIPQDATLRFAYRTMAMKTQAAIEEYLAALEQEEAF